MTTEESSEGALAGIRVLDLTTGLAGPFCTKLLADAGAEVVKVEDTRSGGDWTRSVDVQPDRPSPLFVFLNQNKRSVALDLGDHASWETIRAIAGVSDVVVQCSAAGEAERVGMGYDQLRLLPSRPTLVSITPYGLTGPYRDRPGTDLTVAAQAGLLGLLGAPDREPLQPGIPIVAYTAGINGAIGAMAATRARRRDSFGQLVDISVHDVCLRLATFPTVRLEVAGQLIGRSVPFPTFVYSSDGWASVNALSAKHWRLACEFMEMPDAANDVESANVARKRARRAPELQPRMNAWASTRTRLDIFASGQARGVPTGVPFSPLELLAAEHFVQRGLFAPVPGVPGDLLQPKVPFHSSIWRDDWSGAPALGSDNEDIVARAGRTQDEKSG